MFWKNENKDGWISTEKVQMYELQFTFTGEHPTKREMTLNRRCLVVSNTIEEAIAACRDNFPKDFVLHSAVKRNQRCDLIVCDSVLPLAERGENE